LKQEVIQLEVANMPYRTVTVRVPSEIAAH
jgi:hypothetical protein